MLNQDHDLGSYVAFLYHKPEDTTAREGLVIKNADNVSKLTHITLFHGIGKTHCYKLSQITHEKIIMAANI